MVENGNESVREDAESLISKMYHTTPSTPVHGAIEHQLTGMDKLARSLGIEDDDEVQEFIEDQRQRFLEIEEYIEENEITYTKNYASPKAIDDETQLY